MWVLQLEYLGMISLIFVMNLEQSLVNISSFCTGGVNQVNSTFASIFTGCRFLFLQVHCDLFYYVLFCQLVLSCFLKYLNQIWYISSSISPFNTFLLAPGLAFNGRDTDGMRWDGCRNVKILLWEGSNQFSHLIESFNTNTNAWVAQ